MGRHSGAMGNGRLDVPGLVLRARRLADLSQRDLARAVEVSQPTVARWESGEGSPSLEHLQDVLALAGLSLAVLTGDGSPVRPVPRNSARDNADRRFPAHLDVVPPDEQWHHVGSLGARHDRLPPRGWYAHRARRDATTPGPAGGARPPDHPTEFELEVRRHLRRQGSRLPLRSGDQPDCTCPIECEDGASCPESCPCRCEP